jgi:hypothetical protein
MASWQQTPVGGVVHRRYGVVKDLNDIKQRKRCKRSLFGGSFKSLFKSVFGRS